MDHSKRILVTGAAGKVGREFIDRFLADARFDTYVVRALCHNRKLQPRHRLEVVSGPIEDRGVVEQATAGVSHVLHLATSKETPETTIDVSIKGLFGSSNHAARALRSDNSS